MKKLLVGCLVIAVLAGVVLAVGSYLVYRAASPLVQDARDYLRGLAEIGELEKDIVNKSPFDPPASGELTEAQVQRFARVQQQVRADLGQRMRAIEEKYKHLAGTGENAPRPAFGDLLNSLRDLSGVFVDARRYQVNALNREQFSQQEYSWVRDRVFQAAGVEAINKVDLKKISDAVRNGTGDHIALERLPRPEVPAKNRALVKPYLSEMDQWIPLAFFGL